MEGRLARCAVQLEVCSKLITCLCSLDKVGERCQSGNYKININKDSLIQVSWLGFVLRLISAQQFVIAYLTYLVVNGCDIYMCTRADRNIIFSASISQPWLLTS
jgi:hypothetical protein